MTDVTRLLKDLFGRVAEELPGLLDGLELDAVHWQPDPDANPMSWLAWHIGRCEDVQMAEIAGSEQVWVSRGWVERFGLPYRDDDLGYGHTPDQVRAFRVTDVALLTGYYSEVRVRTAEILDRLSEAELDRILDRRWNPPVTVGVRMASIINDVTQHLGQLAYVRGLWQRASQ